jgi:aspartyl-tRNA(Asn)/glutamyl-tRNA(Gln) amidotransferase subunit B
MMSSVATKYETVVGMEVHVELSTQTKVWCGCCVDANAAPNTNVCPICLGMPGTLPVLNDAAVEKTLLICEALGCTISRPCHFERKNYYYPDLPKNYQISQNRAPLGVNGSIDILLPNGGSKTIRINNVHLEEDAGKNLHSDHPADHSSLVDLNRAGTPLVEIVTEADLRSAEEAEGYMRTLRNLLRYLDVSDCKMQEGSIRFEVNVSIRPHGSEAFGTKVEIKNLNSIRTAVKCIQYEELRHAEALDAGRPQDIVQETRLWDEKAGVTRSMRSKETANDYRYFPDPDLVTLEISDERLAAVQAALPELQAARHARFVRDYGLSDYDALVITNERTMAEYYEAAVARHDNPKSIANWMMTEVLRVANEVGEDFDIGGFAVRPQHLGAMVAMIDANRISGKIAKDVFAEMLAGGGDPESIVKTRGWEVVSDAGAIEAWCREAIAAFPEAVADVKAGREKAIGRLVGDVMKKSQGKASPGPVNDLLKRLIAES